MGVNHYRPAPMKGMTPQPRPLVAGGTYHVFPHLHERVAPLDDRDRMLLLRLLIRVVEARAWRLWAYCFMGNHCHLIVRTPEADLAEGMRDWLSSFALRLNRHRASRHAVWHRPYGARLLGQERHAVAAVRYLAMNPVEAGLCSHPSEWPWSSHRCTAGDVVSPAWLATSDVHQFLLRDGSGDGAAAYESLLRSARDGRGPGRLLHPVLPVFPGPMRPLPELLIDRAGDPAEIAEAFYEGHSLARIAAHLDVSASTAGRRLARAA